MRRPVIVSGNSPLTLLIVFHSQVYRRAFSDFRCMVVRNYRREISDTELCRSHVEYSQNVERGQERARKRKITNLLKEGDSLTLSADSGLPSTEFRKLAEQIRVRLDILHANNEHYRNLKCSVLVLGEDATDEKRGVEEETIANTETNYLDEVRDRAIPMIHELIKISEHVLHRDSPPIPISTDPTAQTQTCHLVRIVRIQYGFWPFLR